MKTNAELRCPRCTVERCACREEQQALVPEPPLVVERPKPRPRRSVADAMRAQLLDQASAAKRVAIVAAIALIECDGDPTLALEWLDDGLEESSRKLEIASRPIAMQAIREAAAELEL